MTPELLAPAGNYEIGVAALENGADAIYLGLNRFGARAYAHNFTLEELEKIVNIVNVLNKKVYVTINTIIKDAELLDAYNTLNDIYKLGVHGVITTDFALVNYVINNLPEMECHISTQVGVKSLDDVNFFTKLKANRVVLAREVSIDEIKDIKQNSKMPIEVFIHGALCVSYSGNCYFSSLLTLRSGNRGRCSQNCRREYELVKDGKVVSDKCYLLSTKDLNSFRLIPTLKKLKVDSLKIEGRMKDIDYVKALVLSYRKKLDHDNYETNILDKVFHREYTSGFLNNVDKGSLVNKNRSGNVGEYLGEVKQLKNGYFVINLATTLQQNDRIRIESDKDYYFDATTIYDKNLKVIKEATKVAYLKLDLNIKEGKAYIIKNRNLVLEDVKKIPLDIYLAVKDKDLLLTATYNNLYFTYEEKNILQVAKNRGLTKDDLRRQLAKLNETPFYLNHLEVGPNLSNFFLAVSQINNLRRNLINTIYQSFKKEREIKNIGLPSLCQNNSTTKNIIVTCTTKDQYNALKDLDINIYFDNNYLNYNEYKKLETNDILVSNYGSILLNRDKDLTLNKEFNVFNHHALAYFLTYAKNVTLSQELSFNEIKDLVRSFIDAYHFKPNTDFIIYGHMALMRLKYCPIKNMGYCGKCHTSSFAIKDNTATFPLLTDKNCFTSVLNGKATNLISEITKLKPYINRFRLDFTIESPEECVRLVKEALASYNGQDISSFNKDADTRAYFKREVL